MRREVAASVTLGARHASAEVLDCRIEEIRTKKNAEESRNTCWKKMTFPLENSGYIMPTPTPPPQRQGRPACSGSVRWGDADGPGGDERRGGGGADVVGAAGAQFIISILPDNEES